MSYTYLLEQGEESSAECFSDIPPSVLSKLNLTAGKSFSKGSGTEFCQSSQSGTMSPPSMGNHGEGKSMSSAGDSLAKTYQAPVGGLGSMESEADSGQKWPESLAKYDRNSRSWRTAQCLLFEDLGESLETFPRWGMMHDGELWELTMPERLTSENESGFLPTPQAADRKDTGPHGSKSWMNHVKRKSLLAAFVKEPNNGGRLNPEFSEWLMGWMIGATDLKPLEMDKFQLWLQQHGESLEENK